MKGENGNYLILNFAALCVSGNVVLSIWKLYWELTACPEIKRRHLCAEPWWNSR